MQNMAMAIRSVPELSGKVAETFEKRARETEARFRRRASASVRITELQRKRMQELKKLSSMFRNV